MHLSRISDELESIYIFKSISTFPDSSHFTCCLNRIGSLRIWVIVILGGLFISQQCQLVFRWHRYQLQTFISIPVLTIAVQYILLVFTACQHRFVYKRLRSVKLSGNCSFGHCSFTARPIEPKYESYRTLAKYFWNRIWIMNIVATKKRTHSHRV